MSIEFRPSLLIAAALVLGCGVPTAPAAEADTFGGSETAISLDVSMPGNRYMPNRIDVAQGAVVRFIFPSELHDVRFNGNPSAPADILAIAGTTVSRTFALKGTILFLCTLHANMTGTIVVH